MNDHFQPDSADCETAVALTDDLTAPRQVGFQPVKVPKGWMPADQPRQDLRTMIDDLAASDDERLPWPDEWLKTRDPADHKACRALWGAALFECIRSALGLSPDDVGASKSGGAVHFGWIGGAEFNTMAALAGLDGPALAHRIRRDRDDPDFRDRFIADRFNRRAI